MNLIQLTLKIKISIPSLPVCVLGASKLFYVETLRLWLSLLSVSNFLIKLFLIGYQSIQTCFFG